jgi:hypothetical protein
MNAEDYYADNTNNPPSLSASIAKILIEQTPAHAWQAHPRLNPDYRPIEKEQFDRGSAAHALLLEGIDNIAIIDAEDWRTKAAKEARDLARAQGKYPLLEKHYRDVQEMARVCRDALYTSELKIDLSNGSPEHTLQWQDGPTYFRSRLDWLSNDRQIILDYKTTAGSANPRAWSRKVASENLDIQPAFYLEGNARCDGPEDGKFIWVVQEITPPYAVAIIGASPALIAIGESKMMEATAIWEQCINSNVWPAYPSRVHWIEPEPWQAAQWEEQSFEMAQSRELDK